MPEDERGTPIYVRPPVELRKRLDAEAKAQNRSINNLVIVILMKYFRNDHEAGHAR